MKKFKFSLQEVLHYEETKKEQLLNSLAQINHDIHYMGHQKKSLELILETETHKLFSSPAALKVAFINDFLAYKDSMDKQIEECWQNILALKQKRTLLHKDLIESRKRIDILEKLRQKQLSEHQYELNKEEENLIQEVIETKYIIKKRQTLI